jgi:hypothetical protein
VPAKKTAAHEATQKEILILIGSRLVTVFCEKRADRRNSFADFCASFLSPGFAKDRRQK